MTPHQRKPLKPRDPYLIASNSKKSYDKILKVVNIDVAKINVRTVENVDKTEIADDRWSRLGARPKIRSRTLKTNYE